MNFTQTLMVVAVLTTPTAFAGNISAIAYQNLGVLVKNISSTDLTVTATTPLTSENGYSTVTTSRVQIHSTTYGYGAHATTHLDSNGGGSTNYKLWNLATNKALSSAEAANINLDFQFELTGSLSTQPVLLSTATVDYFVKVYSGGYDHKSGRVSKVVGFRDYSILGDTSLIGSSTRLISVRHTNASGGDFQNYLSTTASDNGYSEFTLTLKGINYVSTHTSPVAALGVKLTETGQTFAVNNVLLASSFPAQADLGIAVTSPPDLVIAGAQLTYTVTVTNNGPDPVTQVKVTNNLPSTVNFVSASVGCTQSVLAITCNVASLASGAQALFNITVVPTSQGALTNTILLTGAETDPQPNNNSATQTVTVLSTGVVKKADLAITQTVNAASVQVDGDLQYTIKVQNNGPDNATSVAITDEFPASANINSATNCSISNTVVNCLVGNLAAGASKSYTVSVSPSEEGSFSSTATVTGGVTDNNQANNSVTKTVTVTNSVVPALANADVGLGDKVTITGEGFSNKKGSVKIGGKTASIVSWADGLIVVKLPALKAGTYAAKVININKKVVDLGQLSVHAPEIGALSIGTAAENTKIQFTVTGQYFGNGVKPAVYLVSSKNKRTAVTVSKGYSDSALTIVTPKLKADTYQVLVTNSVGNSQLVALVVN